MIELSEHEQKDLLSEMAEGSEKAFSRLFYFYHDKLYSFIFNISGSKQLAEDTVQDVFLRIWQRRAESKEILQFDSYIFQMARNHALNAFKRMSKETLILNELGQRREPPDDSNHLEAKEMERSLRQAVEKLPDRQKQVFLLSREQGLKQAEISRIMKITVPTVKSHITQAMHSIKKEFKDQNPSGKIVFFIFSLFFL